MAQSSATAPTTLAYPLQGAHGYLHHWLTLGPHDQRLDAMPAAGEKRAAWYARLLAEHAASACDFDQVVELDRATRDGVQHIWEVTHTAADHWLAWHGFLPTLTYRQAWGAGQLHSAHTQTVTLQVTLRATLPSAARLWLNGVAAATLLCAAQHDGAGETDGAARPVSVTHTAQVTLQAGANPLLLRVEQVGTGASALLAAVSITPAAALTLHLPTVSPNPRRRQRLDEIYAQAQLDRAVYTRPDPIRLLAPARGHNVPVQLRLQKPRGAIYAETLGKLARGTTIESVRGGQLPGGALDAVVMAPFQTFYDGKLRARHTIPILVANQPFHAQPPIPGDNPAADADARLIEALRAQVQGGDSPYAELAKMAFGAWDQVAPLVIEQAVTRVMDGAADALPDLLALITMRARMPAYRGFPPALLPLLDRGLLHVAAHPAAAWDADDDATQLARLAAAHLTAQLYPTLDTAQVTAEALVAWLAAAGQHGLAQWHSDHTLLVQALAPLVSLAQAAHVRESAAALLDLLALAWATHSVHGTFGAARARVDHATVRSGRFAPEAALMRLLWGVGGYQQGVAAATALGLAGASYALPAVIHAIALAQPEAAWMQERHAAANVAIYKTPDYVLSSVQDYRAGAHGGREQVWQATLGPEALVFTTHPASMSQAAAAAPAWWVGNGVLPRVAQYHDALIARYTLPAADWLGFTHAHFPRDAFDESALVEGWAFGRAGDAYVALWAAPAFVLMQQGPDANRELRVTAPRVVWLCQMGRRAVDGDFATFQRKLLVHAPRMRTAETVTWTTARGDVLTLGDVGPLLVNGQAVPLDHFPRHSSPFGHADFPAAHMDIVYGEDGLRLHF